MMKCPKCGRVPVAVWTEYGSPGWACAHCGHTTRDAMRAAFAACRRALTMAERFIDDIEVCECSYYAEGRCPFCDVMAAIKAARTSMAQAEGKGD